MMSSGDASSGEERRHLDRIIMMVEEGKEFSLRRVLGMIEISLVQRALRKAGGSRARAARLLGLSERSVGRYLAKLL